MEWKPEEERGEKWLLAQENMLVGRVAFVEAAREAGIYVDTTPRPPSTGKLGHRWGKRKPMRRV